MSLSVSLCVSLCGLHQPGATEPWGYGDVSLAAIEKAMKVREELREYIMTAMALVSQTGQPINRPLL